MNQHDSIHQGTTRNLPATRLGESAEKLPVIQGSSRVLWLSTWAFTVLFAVWVMLGVLSIPIRKELHLTEGQVGWLLSIAVLTGSLLRLTFGLWTDRFGGRRVMTALLLATAIPCALVGYASSYFELCLLALLFGIAGNGFSVGIAWCSAWFDKTRQGTALGIFGAGNVGASLTKLVGPLLIGIVSQPLLFGLVPAGWRFVPVMYSALLVATALLVWSVAPAMDRTPASGRSLRELLRPLSELPVWRFSLYYVVVFGAYVALAVWLPKYYVDVFGVSLSRAATLTALFIFPASLLRPLGGWLSDRFGATPLMYWVFSALTLACSLLAIPKGNPGLNWLAQMGVPIHPHSGLGIVPFTVLLLVIAAAMGIGKAAVYKYVPEYYPRDVGAVGGLVGLLGALGGFFLPPAFAYGQTLTGNPQAVFLILLLVTLTSLGWLHASIRQNAARAWIPDGVPSEAQQEGVTG